MKKSEIKNIMIYHYDNDFIRSFDWIGQIVLKTILEPNICGESLLNESDDIEHLIVDLLPVAIKYIQYPNILGDGELIHLVDHLSCRLRFKYNFDHQTDDDYIYGGSETLIIDLEQKTSYIR